MIGGSKLKKVFQRYSPPGIERRLKDIYNRLSKFQAYFIKRRIRPPYPTYLQIEPTIRCNIFCTMCRREKQLKNLVKAPDMTLAQFKIILDQFPAANYINLQGNGEPFLNKDIINMISTAKKKDIYTLTATNGTLLNKKVREGILESGLDKLIVSFIASDKEIYEGIMRGADFQKAKDNVSSLTELKRKKSLRYPKIILATGFLKSNINDLIKFPDLSKELGVDGIDLGPFFEVDSSTPEISHVKKVLADIEKIAARKKVSLYINKNEVNRKYRAKECLWPWQGVYITVIGDIKPCCSRAYSTDISFGNIYEDNLDSIWYSRNYINFRKGLKGESPMPLICRGCPWD